MEKTIENLKKFLHIGGGKRNEKTESFSPEKAKVNQVNHHHSVTAFVEVSQDEIIKR